MNKGNWRVNNERFEITKLCEDLIEELQILQKEDQQINYSHVGKKKVENLDMKMLTKVITNLLSNAIKFSNEGDQIEVLTKVKEEDLTIQVSDQGIGIPEKEQPDMWRQFYRASNVSNIQGTGVGLNISKRHVELMGGTIGFESKEGWTN
ncbi:MAG: hypothetical protein GY816_04115 [Cytophagales bacterium]|nr:hypothetical protein [Cytophagales bacterium]